MSVLKIEIGSWYWVAARGPARVTALPDGVAKTTYTVELMSGITYWCSYAELNRLSSTTLDTYERDLKSRVQLNVEELEGLDACREWLKARRQ